MNEDEIKRSTSHELGTVLDALSVSELQARIVLLEEEIMRLKAAIEKRSDSRKAAEAAFKI